MKFSCSSLVSTIALRATLAADFQFRDQELPTRLTVGYAVRLLDMNDDAGSISPSSIATGFCGWKIRTGPSTSSCRARPRRTTSALPPTTSTATASSISPSGGLAAWQPDATQDRRHDPVDHRRQQSGRANGSSSHHGISDDAPHELCRPRRRWPPGVDRLAAAWAKTRRGPTYAEHGTPLLAYQVPADPVKGPGSRKSSATTFTSRTISRSPISTATASPTSCSSASKACICSSARPTANGSGRGIGAGNQETSPNKGSSEIKLGKLAGGANYIATIEPWHGHQVVVYTQARSAAALNRRVALEAPSPRRRPQMGPRRLGRQSRRRRRPRAGHRRPRQPERHGQMRRPHLRSARCRRHKMVAADRRSRQRRRRRPRPPATSTATAASTSSPSAARRTTSRSTGTKTNDE